MTAADRPTPPHPDLDTLADLDADALDAAAAAQVAAHVAGCARCTEIVATLGVVRADLRALPAPELPGAVAARLDAALAGLRPGTPGRSAASGTAGAAGISRASGRAEAREATGPGAPSGPSGDMGRANSPPLRSVTDLGAARGHKRRRTLKAASEAVAAALVLLAAGASVSWLVHSTGSDAGSAGGGGAEAPAVAQASGGGSDSGQLGGSPGPSGVPSYSRESLSASLDAIERDSAAPAGPELGETGPAGAMASPARRQACERSIVGRQGKLGAVRRIVYEGKPAYVFVFENDGRRTGYVVTDECGTGGLPAVVLDRVS